MSIRHFHTLSPKRDFTLIRPLGSGYYSEVHEARPADWTPTDRRLALKLYRRERFTTARLAQYRDHEHTMGTRIKDHRYVVRPLEAGWGIGVGGATTYLLMELVDGHNLKVISLHSLSLRRSESMLDIQEIHSSAFALHLLLALQALHAVDVLHMDIKPSNIMLNHQEDLTLIDLGAATNVKMPAVHTAVEKYAAPEVFLRSTNQIGPWSDLYSVGRVLGELEKWGLELTSDVRKLRKTVLRQEPQRRPRSVKEALGFLR